MNAQNVSLFHYWMNRLKILIILPVAHVIAIVYALPTLNRESFAVFLVALFLGQIGYTVGYHRLLTHKSFETYPVFRYFLILLGICAAQDGPIAWAAVHRKHHRYADDVLRDPHTPWRSFFYGYMGWTFGNEGLLRSKSFYRKWAPDLMKDPALRFFDQYDFFLLGLSALFLYAVGGWDWLVWGFFVRIVVGLHIFWMLNTFGHLFGSRPWKTRDHSTNNFIFGLLVQGEGWHNNHHYAPRSARHGFRWWQIDVTWYLIWILERLGFVWNVIRPPKVCLQDKIRFKGDAYV